jgi:hypothetical protein
MNMDGLYFSLENVIKMAMEQQKTSTTQFLFTINQENLTMCKLITIWHIFIVTIIIEMVLKKIFINQFIIIKLLVI